MSNRAEAIVDLTGDIPLLVEKVQGERLPKTAIVTHSSEESNIQSFYESSARLYIQYR